MRLLIALILLFSNLAAKAPSDDVVRARGLLLPGTWSKVLAIENDKPNQVYPETTYALVFEFNSLLWFYYPENGTQSLSQYIGRLERDKDELLPLLKGIHAGFRGYRIERNLRLSAEDTSERIRNACFIESVRALGAEVGRVRQASLLCCYFGPEWTKGHTVLLFTDETGTYVIDSAVSAGPRLVMGRNTTDPMQLAEQAYPGRSIWNARCLSVSQDTLRSLNDRSKYATAGAVSGEATG